MVTTFNFSYGFATPCSLITVCTCKSKRKTKLKALVEKIMKKRGGNPKRKTANTNNFTSIFEYEYWMNMHWIMIAMPRIRISKAGNSQVRPIAPMHRLDQLKSTVNCKFDGKIISSMVMNTFRAQYVAWHRPAIAAGLASSLESPWSLKGGLWKRWCWCWCWRCRWW